MTKGTWCPFNSQNTAIAREVSFRSKVDKCVPRTQYVNLRTDSQKTAIAREVPSRFFGPVWLMTCLLSSEEGTPSMLLTTFVLKLAQAKARIWR